MHDTSRGSVNAIQFDSRYVEELRNGGAVATTHFVEYFGGLLNRMLRRRLRCPALVEDVRQETLTRVLVSIRRDQIRKPERLALFVFGVCRRVVRESLRQQQAVAAGAIEADSLVDESADPGAQISCNERTRCVHNVLARLSPRDREILRLVYLDDADRADVSSRFGVAEDGLRLMLHRARLRFKSAVNAAQLTSVLAR